MSVRLARALLLVALLCPIGLAQVPIRYFVSLADRERHLVKIRLEIPPGQDTHELQLPVWNALYQVRDFSQNMNWLRAKSRRIADALTGIPKLEALSGIENVEPQMLMESVPRT